MQGSLGAIRHALEQVQTDEVRINILHEGTGDITDNDILLASASNAVVVGFNTKVDPQARRTAEAEGVEVRLYDIIYQLTDEMGAALRGLLEPEIIEVVEGRAEVRQIFRAGRNVIAGCYVTEGRIVRGGARVYRGGKLDRDGSDRVAAPLPRRRARGRHRLRVRHRPRRLQRGRRGRHHRVLHAADGVPRRLASVRQKRRPWRDSALQRAAARSVCGS